jgi:hypothetical protein
VLGVGESVYEVVMFAARERDRTWLLEVVIKVRPYIRLQSTIEIEKMIK